MQDNKMKALMLMFCALPLTTVSSTEAHELGKKNVLGYMGRSKRQIQKFGSCSNRWKPFAGHCYQVSTTTVSWNTAVSNCRFHNSYLVEIDSEEENDFVLWLTKKVTGTFVPSTSIHDCYDLPFSYHTWIGLNDQKVEGHFVWAQSGATPSFTPWGANNPDDWDFREDCVELVGNISFDNLANKWNDDSCDCKKLYVCETETTTTTAETTTTPPATEITTTPATAPTRVNSSAAKVTTAAATATTVATTPINSLIRQEIFVFAAIGFVTAVVISGVVCAVWWRRRQKSKGLNSGRDPLPCGNADDISPNCENNYSELVVGENETHHYAIYRQGQVRLDGDGGVYEKVA